ncbi:YbaK/EbsC family protein [Streptomyces sp. NPDC088194]|uniref:YbaK/EbsC family protein n=1 Tax=Streptomyces sp. NPDC088194 TaxID=3154931 RepID=UPI00344FE201
MSEQDTQRQDTHEAGDGSGTHETHETYGRLIALLDEQGAQYRTIDHEPEGATEVVSALRGNSLAQAAKCIVVMVKVGKKVTRYVLAVVPGDRRVDLGAVKALLSGTYVSFASRDIAERLAGSVSGTVLPFSFDEKLELVVDPGLLVHDEIYFNAARLDRSLALSTKDYVRVAAPRTEPIAGEPAAEQPAAG